jgi:RNA polymerase sigma-70 factor (ECF subfamily)
MTHHDGPHTSDPLPPGELDDPAGVEETGEWAVDVELRVDAAAAAPAPHIDFEEIVQKHGRRLYILAFRLTGAREEAEDLSQETLVKGYLASARFEGRSDFYTYLYRTLINLWKNQIRRRRRWRMVPLFGGRETESGERDRQDAGGAPGARLADGSPGPHERLARREESEKLQRALGRLGAEFRAVLVLRVAEGLEYEEIAASLGIPVGTVRSRLARARRRIRELLDR